MLKQLLTAITTTQPHQSNRQRSAPAGVSFRKWVGALAALLIASIVFSAEARASCGAPTGSREAIVLPAEFTGFQLKGLARDTPRGVANAAIVGLWHVKFTLADGTLYDEGFDQFHSDGTEILNDNGVPPAEGNVCLGVYKKVGHRTYKVKHPAFVWDKANTLVGTLVIRETLTVDAGRNSYRGSFVFDFYDLSGNLVDQVTGNVSGERIMVD